jgi:hypothetical protein
MNTRRELAGLFKAAVVATTMLGCAQQDGGARDAGTDSRGTGIDSRGTGIDSRGTGIDSGGTGIDSGGKGTGGTSSTDGSSSSGGDTAKEHVRDGSSCAALEACTANGGRGNVCGGVISGPHMLHGAGFDRYEGARVVAAFNHTTIRDGSFTLDAGDYAGCPAKSVAYRIDVSPNGHCDDGIDLVFVVPMGTGGPDLYISESDHGTPSTCTEFPSGYDLDLAVEPSCFHSCGRISAGLFENGTRVGDLLGVYFDVTPPLAYTFVGALAPGHEYELRYDWTSRSYCAGTTHFWRQTFTAEQGISTVPVIGDDTFERGSCLAN